MSKPFSLSKKPEFVGLSNQGATCYMNSLLQTLYMTPEFRREIYKWKYHEKFGSQDTCIPLQLQILFARLQTSQLYSIETTALTKSFGWTQAESFQQHDVQEFCRVLFDAIEKSAKEAGSAKFIQDLYEGTYEDYVKCSECLNESVREDKFLDLSLTIKNQFERIYNDSVEKALAGFVRSEFLTASNQYYCENCKSKRDAQKGLKFKKLPYILVLQLKRYDYDYLTNKRIKINDKVTFEEIMNLNLILANPPLYSVQMDIDHPPQVGLPFNMQDFSSHSFQYKEIPKREYLQTPVGKKNLQMDMQAKRKYKEKKFLKKQEERTQKIEEFLKQGPYVYELYSIMIHSGSAWGGHYYAYIKSFETGKWYNFNDSNVVEISYVDVNKVFGGPSNFGSSTSAYLLMYRQINRERNLMSVPDSEISEETTEILRSIQRKTEEDNQRRLDDLKKITVNVKYKSDFKEIVIKNDEPVSHLKTLALAGFQLNVECKNARIRDVEINGRPGKIFPDMMQLNKLAITYNKKVMLETKQDDQEFEDFDPSKINIKYVEWTAGVTLEDIESKAKNLKVTINSSSRSVLDSVAQNLGVDSNEIVIFKKASYGLGLEKTTASNAVKASYPYHVNIQENTTFYVERLEQSVTKTNWELFFEQESAKLTIRVLLEGENQIKNDRKVLIHPQKTLADLVLAISAKLGLPADSIILKKFHNNNEIKDLTQLVKSLSPYNEIIALKGTPLKANQVRLSIYYTGINTKPLKDSEFFRLFYLFDIPADIDVTFKDLKHQILRELAGTFPSVQLSSFRLREVRSESISKWLDENLKVCEYTKDDGKKIAVQSIPFEDVAKEKDDIIISFKKLNTLNWELEHLKDVIINTKSTYHQLGESLAALYNIPIENVEIFKINSNQFNRNDLKTANFERLAGRTKEISQPPYYLAEGHNLIVKNTEEKIREMTLEEKLKFLPKNAQYAKFTYREKDLKISVRNH